MGMVTRHFPTHLVTSRSEFYITSRLICLNIALVGSLNIQVFESQNKIGVVSVA
jgi:hypothetical protein